MAGEIGTLDWTRRTGGRLRRAEIARFLAGGMRSQLKLMPAQATAALGLRRDRLASLDLDELRLPDSAAARAAEELCDEQPAYLRNHARRSYLWAAALARHHGLTYDEEVTYVGALVHDYGVPGAVAERDERCFTLRSAEAAHEAGRRGGWESERADAAAEAITLHLNPAVGPEMGMEAHVMHAGIALDVVGMRRWEIDDATADAILALHPRAELKRELRGAFGEHASHAPRCRVHVLLRYGSFGLLVRRAPFAQ